MWVDPGDFEIRFGGDFIFFQPAAFDFNVCEVEVGSICWSLRYYFCPVPAANSTAGRLEIDWVDSIRRHRLRRWRLNAEKV